MCFGIEHVTPSVKGVSTFEAWRKCGSGRVSIGADQDPTILPISDVSTGAYVIYGYGHAFDADRQPRLPEPSLQRSRHQHAAVRKACRRMGERDRLSRVNYGTHSLHRTKAALIYKQTGNLHAVQILLGHTKIERTV